MPDDHRRSQERRLGGDTHRDEDERSHHELRATERTVDGERRGIGRREWVQYALLLAFVVIAIVVALYFLRAEPRTLFSDARSYQSREGGIALGAPESPALRWFVDETRTAPMSSYHAFAANWCEAWVADWGVPLSGSTAQQVAKQYADLGYDDEPYRGATYLGCLEGLMLGP